MSAHGTRATGRHPETTRNRQHFDIAHVRFEVEDHPVNGCTFALRPVWDIHHPKVPPVLFSGHIVPGMGTMLRRLAHRIDELEAKVRAREAS